MCSYVLLIWLQLNNFVTLLAARFQAADPTLYTVASVVFAVSSWKQTRIYVRHEIQRNRNFMYDINSSCDNGLFGQQSHIW